MVSGDGATMAVDFMLLRVLLGQRLERERMHGGDAPAAAFYAGFHLPFNIGAVLATLLFQGMARLEDGTAWLAGGLSAMVLVVALGGVMALGRATRREDGAPHTEQSFF
jgi:hypothetical protein